MVYTASLFLYLQKNTDSKKKPNDSDDIDEDEDLESAAPPSKKKKVQSAPKKTVSPPVKAKTKTNNRKGKKVPEKKVDDPKVSSSEVARHVANISSHPEPEPEPVKTGKLVIYQTHFASFKFGINLMFTFN